MRIARALLLLCTIGIVAADARADDSQPQSQTLPQTPAPQTQASETETPPRWYTAISGSVVYLNKTRFNSGLPHDWISYDFGYGYSVAVGAAVLPDVRWELEVSGHESSVKHDPGYIFRAGYVENPNESTAVMTNAYYDFHNTSHLVPYLGAGVGDAYVRTARGYMGEGKVNGWALSYQCMAGLSYEFTRSLAMNVGYRYFSGQDVHVNLHGTDISYPNTSHNIEAGVRMFFN